MPERQNKGGGLVSEQHNMASSLSDKQPNRKDSRQINFRVSEQDIFKAFAVSENFKYVRACFCQKEGTRGTQIQLQSKQQIELTEQLTQIEQASQRVNQAFQETLNNLESSKETSRERLVATFKDAQNHFNEQTKTVNRKTIDELQQINSLQKRKTPR